MAKVNKNHATPTSLRGTLTPQEVRAAIHALCEKHDYNPFEELIKLAKGTQEIEIGGEIQILPLCSVEQKIHIAEALAPYLAPKLKNMEITGDVKQDYNITVRHFVVNGAHKESPYVSEGEMKRLMDVSLDEALKEAGDIEQPKNGN